MESPYAGEVEENVKYARACLRDCLLRGEAPFASHLLYTQPGVLDDAIPEERKHGIEAGLAFRAVVKKSAIYVDRGISGGMKHGIEDAKKSGRTVEYRSLYKVVCTSCGVDAGCYYCSNCFMKDK